MKVLIQGAGIAGLTLAALLKGRGLDVDVIEARKELSGYGYMLGISPLGSRVLYGLGLMEAFLDKSVPSDSYAMCTGNGETIHQFSLRQVYENYGPNRACTRGTLIRVLLSGCDGLSIRKGVSIAAIEQEGNEAHVELSDGTHATYDLIVGADGLNSGVRELILSESEFEYFDTGWGGWLWWTDDPKLKEATATEFWGSGHMLGIYPTEYRYGAFAILPAEDGKISPYPGLRSNIRQAMSDLIANFPRVFEQIPQDNRSDMSYWPLRDVRCNVWHKSNVVLIGDAAVGFLPTSGAGASMAMESAAVLADELGRTDNIRLNWALSLYQKRREARLIEEQDEARNIAKSLFVKSSLKSHLRNLALQKYTTEAFSEGIKKIFDAPI